MKGEEHKCTTCHGVCNGAKCADCGHEVEDHHNHEDDCPSCSSGTLEVRCAGCSNAETHCSCSSTTSLA